MSAVAVAVSSSPPRCTAASHDAAKADPAMWRRFLFIGHQSDGLPGGTTYEMRNCPRCGSSLLRPVERSTAKLADHVLSPRGAS